MPRALLILTAVLLSTGCAHRPLRVVMTGDMTAHMPAENTASRLQSRTVAGSTSCEVRIALIDVDGLLLNQNFRGYQSLGENPVALFREKLAAAEADPTVCAMVLRIDSPGGGVTASDMMRRDLVDFQARRRVPIVACLMDVGTGGAYYLATAADTIVAHPTTVTGGVGVILNLYNLQDTSGQFNVLPLPVTSGKKIDIGSPMRPMEAEERELLEQIAKEFHERFTSELRRSRPQVLVTEEDLDGRVFTASQALDKRLIDTVGYLDDALDMARQSAGLPPTAGVIMYRRCNDRALTPYDVTPNVPLQNSLLPMNVPGLDRSTLPRFLYLWQPDPSLVTTQAGR
jgi:protease-4